MALPPDYVERVYAGVLGKIIGVYLGRPIEGWPFDRIERELGEVWYFVHDQFDLPIIQVDDDISGTFAFVRALSDHGNSPTLSAEQIGQTWLNYIIKERTILWWGGKGHSTEHTAYLNLAKGILPPRSGSIEQNGAMVAEQIGAQIFIDGWAMVAPGNPELAANLAERAASVSHGGEAVIAAQLLAAMEAQAFVESDRDKLLDVGLSLIPHGSTIYRLVNDVREWHAHEPDWRRTRARVLQNYGPQDYHGNVHIITNHALVLLGLLYGDDDFQKSLMIANTSGQDTDCNAGNLGCLLGIKNGLAGLDAGADFRNPVADRLYVSTAEGGRSITDAVTETLHIVNIGRALVGEPALAPKNGARFHFELPGSVQGFGLESSASVSHMAKLENVVGHSDGGTRSLALHYKQLTPNRYVRASTPTFMLPDAIDLPGYHLEACPTLYPGQVIEGHVSAAGDNQAPLRVRWFVRVYDATDKLRLQYGPETVLGPGESKRIEWILDDTAGYPVAKIGLEIQSNVPATGTVYLDYLNWHGAPRMTLVRPDATSTMWQRAWANGFDQFQTRWAEPFRLAQNEGRGLLIQGTRHWTDYRVSADFKAYSLKRMGLGARVQGLGRFYGLLMCDDGKVRLIKALDGDETLVEADYAWEFWKTYRLTLDISGAHIRGWINDTLVCDVVDSNNPLLGGAIALICEEGTLSCNDCIIGASQSD